jgi:hypothetical protein
MRMKRFVWASLAALIGSLIGSADDRPPNSVEPGLVGYWKLKGDCLDHSAPSGVFRSTDSGVTWARVRSGSVNDLIMDPSNPATLYAGVQSDGVYKTITGGEGGDSLQHATSTPVGSASLPLTYDEADELFFLFCLLIFHSPTRH